MRRHDFWLALVWAMFAAGLVLFWCYLFVLILRNA